MNGICNIKSLRAVGLTACVLLGFIPHLLVRVATTAGDTWMTRWKFREQTQIGQDYLSRDQILGMDYQWTRCADWTFRPVRLLLISRLVEGGRETFEADNFVVSIPDAIAGEPRADLVRVARDMQRRRCSTSARTLALEDLQFLRSPHEYLRVDTEAPGYAQRFVEVMRSGVPCTYEASAGRGEFSSSCDKVFWYLEAAGRQSDYASSPLCIPAPETEIDPNRSPYFVFEHSRMSYLHCAADAAAESHCPDCIRRVRYFLSRRSAYPLDQTMAYRIIEKRVKESAEGK
ncbi:MAG: hypothetical protein EBS87_11025 [Sphingomonadaceae bacterium]|jgi:hypothetical protein|nr:hypothetical protein [Sphingomonadaceae bacterium]NCA02681.1 hypothetical protein [Sphingomonadaceae bacterium]